MCVVTGLSRRLGKAAPAGFAVRYGGFVIREVCYAVNSMKLPVP